FGLHALGVGPLEILAQRPVWSLMTALILVLLTKESAAVRALIRRPRTLATLTLSALLIGANWGVFIWAVLRGAALEASLGYYLNPLLNMAAGALLFGERFDRIGAIAVALASIGVVAQTLAVGHMPWIALALALTFCAYGIVRKRVAAEALTG